MDKEQVNNHKRQRSNYDSIIVSESKRFKEDDINQSHMNSRSTSINCGITRPLATILTNDSTSMLPQHLIHLLDMFMSLDLVLNKIINCRQVPYISQIEKVLQQMNKNYFNEKLFGQILAIFPESYSYEFEKTPIKCTHSRTDRLQIFPNLQFGILNDTSPRKSMKSLSLSQLLLRKNTMRERLLIYVKEKHDDYLVNVKKMKIEDIRKMKIIRWSSGFDLNGVSEIVPKSLDKNNKIEFESPLVKTFTKSMTIEAEKSQICKNLFGTGPMGKIISEENNCEVKGLVEPNKSVESRKIRKGIKKLNQSQLSIALNANDRSLTKVVQSPRKEHTNSQKQKLPFHLKVLFDFFVNFDKTVQSLFMRGELTYLTQILKTLSMSKTYTEYHFGQLLTVYPDAYKLRWEKVLNKQTNKLSKKLDIIVTALLRNDGTEVSLSSPEKGFIKFDCVRLTQRHQKFLEHCVKIVEESREVFTKKHGTTETFNVDLHVDIVEAAALPPRPVETDAEKSMKISSIADMFNIMKKRRETELKDVAIKNEVISEKLKSVPQSLIDRIRQNKNERSLFAKNNIDEKRRLILERLPRLVTSLWMAFKKEGNDRPIEKRCVISLVCREMDLSEKAFDEHVHLLNEVAPGSLQILDWNPPCMQRGPSRLSSDEIRYKLALLLNGGHS